MPQGIIPDPTLLKNGPDMDGWRDAQNRLRVALGQDITFKVPIPAVYAAGVQLDPENGRPYDPTIKPESGGGTTDVIVRVSVVSRPIRAARPEDDVDSGSAAGPMLTPPILLLVGVTDSPTIQDAVSFVYDGRNFAITDIIADGLTRVDRYIVYGEAK